MQKKVALALSGGIDSAVSALLLKEMGYEVVGVHFQFWTWEKDISSSSSIKNSLIEDIRQKIGIRIDVVNYADLFKETIVKNFISELSKGHTPNPCMRCNTIVKFKLLMEFANNENILYLSTGHYARVACNVGHFKLLKGVDPNKDQSYMLSYLNQDILSRTISPFGDTYKKKNIILGKNLGLQTIEYGESQDLCFVNPSNYIQFIHESIPESHPGDIVDSTGKKIGQHRGLVYYTIGQRKGIKISAEKPFYVIRKDLMQNQLVVGYLNELGGVLMVVENVNWIDHEPHAPFTCDVKIRYRSPSVKCTLEKININTFKVILSQKLRDITPGQYAVFYLREEVLGGGMIIGLEQ